MFLVANYSHVVSTLKECSSLHGQVASPHSGSPMAISFGKMGALAIKDYEVHLNLFTLSFYKHTFRNTC